MLRCSHCEFQTDVSGDFYQHVYKDCKGNPYRLDIDKGLVNKPPHSEFREGALGVTDNILKGVSGRRRTCGLIYCEVTPNCNFSSITDAEMDLHHRSVHSANNSKPAVGAGFQPAQTVIDAVNDRIGEAYQGLANPLPTPVVSEEEQKAEAYIHYQANFPSKYGILKDVFGEDKVKAVEVKFKSGVASSKCPQFFLIPRNALIRLANVFQLGIERKGEAAWNVYSSQEALGDREFTLDRISHIIKHALIYRDKLIGAIDWEDPKYKEDDAAAIMWGGAFLAEAEDYVKKQKG